MVSLKLKALTVVIVVLFSFLPASAISSQHRHKVVNSSTSRHNRIADHQPAVSRHGKHRLTRSARRSRTNEVARSTKHGSKRHRHVAARPRYAYPISFFLLQPPTFDTTPLPDEISQKIRKAFAQGCAGQYPTRSLVKAQIASYYPMRGGIFWRREPIKYIIMHSTEPGIPVGAKTIVDGWSHGGRRHAGAHYVVDRDGTIYQAVDPDLATVHINIFKTLPGINNDNSVGIEMCHQGSQDYPVAEVQSAIRLAVYLQSHYHVQDSNVITHRYAQQGDHTDPVHFAWDDFIAEKKSLQNLALNLQLADLKSEAIAWKPVEPVRMQVEKATVQDMSQVKTGQTVSTPDNMAKLMPPKAPETGNMTPTDNMTPADNKRPTGNIVPAAISPAVPTNPNQPSRLLPVTPVNRLIPASMVIDNRTPNSYQQLDSAGLVNSNRPITNGSSGNQSRQLLPLRGAD